MRPPRHLPTKLVLGGIAVLSIFALGLGVGLSHTNATPLTVAGTAATPSPTPGKSGPPYGRGGGWLGASAGAVVGAIAKETGLTPAQIVTDIRNGQTLDQIAGSKAAKVHDDAVAAVKTRLDAAVSRGVLTQTQADHLLADASDAITQLMGAKLGAGAGTGKAGVGFGFPFLGGQKHLLTPAIRPTPAA